MRIILILFLLAYCTCESVGQAVDARKDFSKLSWLEGTWTRTNVKPGRTATERWERSGSEWRGWGVSMKGPDTSFVEKLKIVARGNDIFYVADVPENPKPVDFKVTAIDDNGFTIENPAHDFPKKMVYRRDGKNLRAVISGDGKEIEFLFTKQ